MSDKVRKGALFLFLAAGVYSCYLTSAIYHQKILKHAYTNRITHHSAYFKQSLLFCIFPPLVASIIGRLVLCFQKDSKTLPIAKSLLCGAIINSNVLTYNMAVVQASFPAIVMAKSCSLLSVIIVGVFCSGVKDSKLKLTHRKLLIGCLATVGIVFFNFFKKKEAENQDKPLELVSLGTLFLLISLVGDGFLPDIQAQIKSEYKPSVMDMYYNINRYTAIIGLVVALLTNRLPYIIQALFEYEDFAQDVAALAVLNAVGQLFIYRMIKQFQQHIPAFVIAFRKCLTVLINIFWFGHSVNLEQFIGVGLVFMAVMWEVWDNQKKKEGNGDASFQKLGQSENRMDEMEEIVSKNYDQQGILDAIDEELNSSQPQQEPR